MSQLQARHRTGAQRRVVGAMGSASSGWGLARGEASAQSGGVGRGRGVAMAWRRVDWAGQGAERGGA